ncbi:MAG: efflux RND transporter permease subunit [bacterium]
MEKVNWLSRLAIRYPRATVAFMAATALFFLSRFIGIGALEDFWHILRFKVQIDADISNMIPVRNPIRVYNDEVKELFGHSEGILIGVVSEDGVFKKNTLSRIIRMTEAVKTIDGVRSEDVLSLSTADRIEGTEFGIEVKPLMGGVPETEEGIRNLKETVLSDDMYAGNIVSKDGSSTLIVAPLVDDRNTDAVMSVYREVKKLIEEEGKSVAEEGSGERFYVAGQPVVYSVMARNIRMDLLRLLPAVLSVLIVVLFVFFRRARGVILPLWTTAVAVIWTFGLMAIARARVTMIVVSMPIILIAIGCADGIHITSEFLNEFRRTRDKREAIERTMRKLGSPVVMTSLTTMAGFGSLATSPIPNIRDLGIFVSWGVLVAMVFSLTFIPASLLLMKPPKEKGGRASERSGDLAALGASALERFVSARPRTVLAAAALVFSLSILSALRIVIDSDMLMNFKEGSEIKVSDRILNSKFGGTKNLIIVLEAEGPDAFKEPEILKEMDELERYLKGNASVGGAASLADYVKRMNRVMHGDDPEFDRIPNPKEIVMETDWIEKDGKEIEIQRPVEVSGRDQVAQYLLLYENAGGKNLDKFVDYEYRRANIRVQTRVRGSSEGAEVMRRIEEHIASNGLPKRGVRVNFAGFLRLMVVVSNMIVKGQLYSLFTSLIVVMFMMALVHRSLVGGLLSVVPITITVAMNFGMMSALGITLNIGTALIASVSIGIGVDYAIHFLSRYRMEIAEHKDPARASVITMASAGKAILVNALAVAAGFAVLLLSNFIPLVNVGWLTAVTMLTSFLGAVTVLPALLITLKPRFLSRKGNALTAGFEFIKFKFQKL